MLNLSIEFLQATGYTFPEQTEVRILSTATVHTLMAVVEAKGNRFRERNAEQTNQVRLCLRQPRIVGLP
jgi:hypothetical protein